MRDQDVYSFKKVVFTCLMGTFFSRKIASTQISGVLLVSCHSLQALSGNNELEIAASSV
jgi:hypothetical protein